MKKYKLTDEAKTLSCGTVLHRIEALIDGPWGPAGTKGGWVEGEKNLSHLVGCWVHGNAWVCDNALVSDNAQVYGGARVFGDARVSCNAMVHGSALVFDNAFVFDNARVFDNAKVYGNALVSGDTKIESCHINDDYTKYTLIRYDNMLGIGCEHRTVEDWESLTPDDVADYDSGASAWWDEHKESVIKWARSVS